MKATILKGNLTGYTVDILGWAHEIGGQIYPLSSNSPLHLIVLDSTPYSGLVGGRKVLYYLPTSVSILPNDVDALPSIKSPENIESFIKTLESKLFFISSDDTGNTNNEKYTSIQEAIKDITRECKEDLDADDALYLCVPVLKFTTERKIVITKV